MSGPEGGATPSSARGRPTSVAQRRLVLRWGLPRDPAAGRHLAGFVVAAVATVLLTRAYLAATDYPQIGGGGLHIAHVLWGGLLMALAFVLLLSFAGPAVRPVGALVGGVGFGLFVDEVGKFVTADNDYFYEPTAAIVYGTVVGLVLLADALHGRTEHAPEEHLAGAVDHAVAGVVGGLTPHARDEATALLARAGDVPGVRETRALLDAVEEDHTQLPNPIDRTGRWVVAGLRRVVGLRWAPWLTVGVLVLAMAWSVGRGLSAWLGGADVPGWVVTGLLLGATAAAAVAATGLAVVRHDRERGYRLFRRAVLVNLLLTQVFVFRIEQWGAVTGLVVELLVLGLVVAELSQTERARAAARTTGGGTTDGTQPA